MRRFVCDVPASDLLPFSPDLGLMNALPHVSTERVTELLTASGAPLDTPTPRVTAAQESAAASLASSSASSLAQESGAVTHRTDNGGKKGSKTARKGSLSSAHDWVSTSDAKVLSTSRDGKHFDGSGWLGGADTITSMPQAEEARGKTTSRTRDQASIGDDSTPKLHRSREEFAADAQAERAGLRSSHRTHSVHSTAASSDDTSADSMASFTPTHPQKPANSINRDASQDTDASVMEALDTLGGAISSKPKSTTTKHVSTGASVHQEFNDTHGGRQLMAAVSDNSGDWMCEHSYAGRQYLSLSTQALLLR